MTGYVKAENIAVRWNVSVRQVQLLCQNGKVKDASEFSNMWIYPEISLSQPAQQRLNRTENRKILKAWHKSRKCVYEI